MCVYGTAPLIDEGLYEDKLLGGVLLMCATVFCFTMIDSSAKWLTTVGFVTVQITFVRYFGHFITSLLILSPKHGHKVFYSKSPYLQCSRAVCLMVGTFFNFLALKYLALNITVAIFFAAPLLISMLSIPILGERVPLKQFLAVFLGFCGVLVIIKPGEVGFQFEMVYSLIALFCASMYFILTRLVTKVDTNATSQIYLSGIPTLVILPFVINNWIWPEDWSSYFVMGLMGLSATLGHSFTTIAHRWAKASVLAPVIYVQLIFMTIVSWFVFNHLPTINTIFGTLIIIISGLYLIRLERHKKT
jgi:drug/metabolite transporter (DMT)-like permease